MLSIHHRIRPLHVGRPAVLIALLVAGLTTAFMVWSPAAAAQDGAVVTAPDPVLRVSGSGVVVAVPDMARFEAGVVVQARTAGQALTANGQALNAALEQFAGLGIARRDIRSTQISLSPLYDRPAGGQAPRISGYQAASTLHLVIRDLDRIGAVLDAATQAGLNQAGGLSFDVSDRVALENEALALAVEAALVKARVMAAAAGVTAGRIIELTSESRQAPPYRTMALEARAGDGSVPVVPGELTVSAEVHLVMALTAP